MILKQHEQRVVNGIVYRGGEDCPIEDKKETIKKSDKKEVKDEPVIKS